MARENRRVGEPTGPDAPAPLQASRLQEDLLLASVTRIEGLLRILAQPLLQATLARFFKDGKQLRAYELSDGKRSTRDIARIIHVDQKTISTWWRSWERDQKLVEKAGNRGQYKARRTVLELFLENYPRRLTAETPSSEKESGGGARP